MNLYSNVREFWKKPRSDEFKEIQKPRLMQWRRESSTIRIEHPTRIDRARALGYRAKSGFVVVRQKIRRGSRRMPRPVRGRKGKNMAVSDITSGRNLRAIAETRASKHFTNLEVLGSYWVGQDGRSKWFEIIFVDPHHPVIKSDHRIKWISQRTQQRKAFRGLTAAGRKYRGLYNKGKGAEKVRPSSSSKGNRNK